MLPDYRDIVTEIIEWFPIQYSKCKRTLEIL